MNLSQLNRIIAVFVLIFAVIYGWKALFEARCLPCYTVDVKYVGPVFPQSDDTEDFSIKPFKVSIERSQVDDMINRVSKTRFYELQIIIDGRNVNKSTYGFNRQTVGSIHDYLINIYNWRKTIQELNNFDHYKTNIACLKDLNIHPVRVTHNSQTHKREEAILFLYSWPSSFIEYLAGASILNPLSTKCLINECGKVLVTPLHSSSSLTRHLRCVHKLNAFKSKEKLVN
ncbi:unnamed protein product [Rotaria sordida]|uniref:Epoxide hydrolase N-terminal domain-containing protein n=1 Tax=Rotaria sordida TaxID=392033 RepID=A0A815QT74_9BILA|nr:unnamed protein product [Rotaria sordida]